MAQQKDFGDLISEGITSGFANIGPYLQRRDMMLKMDKQRDFENDMATENLLLAKERMALAKIESDVNVKSALQGIEFGKARELREGELHTDRLLTSAQSREWTQAQMGAFNEAAAIKTEQQELRKGYLDKYGAIAEQSGNKNLMQLVEELKTDSSLNITQLRTAFRDAEAVESGKEFIKDVRNGEYDMFDKATALDWENQLRRGIPLQPGQIIAGVSEQSKYIDKETAALVFESLVPRDENGNLSFEAGLTEEEREDDIPDAYQMLGVIKGISDATKKAMGLGVKEVPDPNALPELNHGRDAVSMAMDAVDSPAGKAALLTDITIPKIDRDIAQKMVVASEDESLTDAERTGLNATMDRLLSEKDGSKEAVFDYVSQPDKEFGLFDGAALLMSDTLEDAGKGPHERSLRIAGRFKDKDTARKAAMLAEKMNAMTIDKETSQKIIKALAHQEARGFEFSDAHITKALKFFDRLSRKNKFSKSPDDEKDMFGMSPISFQKILDDPGMQLIAHLFGITGADATPTPQPFGPPTPKGAFEKNTGLNPKTNFGL